MSNIAGKAYAMNVITPIKGWMTFYINRLIFWVATLKLFSSKLGGLATLSMIHYARWVMIRRDCFPHVHPDQPKENLKYHYMLFFSNFNGSWEQYVDSFHKAIPSGLDLLWRKNLKYPKSVPLQPFHAYINYNQIWTSHYYNAYPTATSNDVKAAKRVRTKLLAFNEKFESMSDEEFKQAYDSMLIDLQHDISIMEDTPVVSLANQTVIDRNERYAKKVGREKSNVHELKQQA